VLKTLGQHEITTVQTITIEPAAAMVNVTTIHAHASGKRIASDWPGCPLAETANRHRMEGGTSHSGGRGGSVSWGPGTGQPRTAASMDQQADSKFRPAANGNGRARGAAKPASPPVRSLS
jgi:hypothetical protein